LLLLSSSFPPSSSPSSSSSSALTKPLIYIICGIHQEFHLVSPTIFATSSSILTKANEGEDGAHRKDDIVLRASPFNVSLIVSMGLTQRTMQFTSDMLFTHNNISTETHGDSNISQSPLSAFKNVSLLCNVAPDLPPLGDEAVQLIFRLLYK
jgi:hypothetical protein